MHQVFFADVHLGFLDDERPEPAHSTTGDVLGKGDQQDPRVSPM
jgi:hypothetical protein